MKKITLFFLSALAAHLSYGQKTEVSVHLTSGAAAFRGASAASNATLVQPPAAGVRPYTSNAYGRRPAFSYGVAGQVQRVTADNTLLGVQAGYEVLRSRVQITSVLDRNGTDIKADGHTTLANYGLNAHPFFGHRFDLGDIALDLTAGPEMGLVLRSYEQGSAVSGKGVSYSADQDLSRPTVDARGRLNLTAYYKQVGLSLGYSRGFTDYRGSQEGGMNGVYSQVFRAGLALRLGL
ncbi:hypothetical protein LGH70_11890 [Hymenobacter sp. BT635]|uniref:Outer membrane protein beta-barrel domain-containing protein n=1 Tax=Hymenobacter nitidus TaxID=2880929 RepID=A0ABS8AGF0_9BACT|nr:hypothetical protein [Hymenobacter nitidus]MCB2378290.1 hypothetical protein [Hymenobacter nitidus]